MNLQDGFLNQLRISKTPATVCMNNGAQLVGIVRGFDNFVIMLEFSGKENLIYKHAISTITPKDRLPFFNSTDDKKSSKPEGGPG